MRLRQEPTYQAGRQRRLPGESGKSRWGVVYGRRSCAWAAAARGGERYSGGGERTYVDGGDATRDRGDGGMGLPHSSSGALPGAMSPVRAWCQYTVVAVVSRIGDHATHGAADGGEEEVEAGVPAARLRRARRRPAVDAAAAAAAATTIAAAASRSGPALPTRLRTRMHGRSARASSVAVPVGLNHPPGPRAAHRAAAAAAGSVCTAARAARGYHQ